MTCLATSPFTMPAALAAADTLFNPQTWTADPDNPEQVVWLESFRRRAGLARGMAEIRSHACSGWQVVQHIAWLKEQGWDAQVTEVTHDAMLLAATIDIVAKWRQVGNTYPDNEEVKRVVLGDEVYTSRSRRDSAGLDEHPIVEVLTQHPSYSFCFQQVDARPANERKLLATALYMASRDADLPCKLDFPAVDLKVRGDASHMIGLRSGRNVVSQACEQFRLELDEVGGRASAAAEVAVTRSFSAVRTVKIDGPFVVAVNRNGAPIDADKVVFAAYVDRDAWKAPAPGRTR